MCSSIAFIKIYNYKDVLEVVKFTEEEKRIIKEDLENENIEFIEYDFNSSTVSDFVDYIEFSDYEELYFIINSYSRRLEKIVNYLNSELDPQSKILENNGSIQINNKFVEFQVDFNTTINLFKMLEMSKQALHTGFYPYQEKVHVKHIFIDNIEDVIDIDISVFLNCAINSIIFYENDNQRKLSNLDTIFPMLMKKEVLDQIENPPFLNISESILKQEIKDFIKYGIINRKTLYINDIARYRKKVNLNALFIKERKIYMDIKKEFLISDNIKNSVFEILNNLNQIDTSVVYSDEVFSQFYVCKMLASENNTNRFITYLTNHKLLSIETISNAKYSEWIAFNEPGGIYLFNSSKNKTYEIDDTVLEIFEYLTKGKENLLKNKIDDKLIESVRGMLS